MKISHEMTTQASTAMEAAKQAKLVKAAQQFEAMLLQEMKLSFLKMDRK